MRRNKSKLERFLDDLKPYHAIDSIARYEGHGLWKNPAGIPKAWWLIEAVAQSKQGRIDYAPAEMYHTYSFIHLRRMV